MDNILKGIIKVEQQLMALDRRGTYIWNGKGGYEIALFVSNNPDDYKLVRLSNDSNRLTFCDNILKWIRIVHNQKDLHGEINIKNENKLSFIPLTIAFFIFLYAINEIPQFKEEISEIEKILQQLISLQQETEQMTQQKKQQLTPEDIVLLNEKLQFILQKKDQFTTIRDTYNQRVNDMESSQETYYTQNIEPNFFKFPTNVKVVTDMSKIAALNNFNSDESLDPTDATTRNERISEYIITNLLNDWKTINMVQIYNSETNEIITDFTKAPHLLKP